MGFCGLLYFKKPCLESESFRFTCGKCKKPIEDEKKMITLDGVNYHGSHFNCALCSCELQSDFKIHNGKYYCFPDYKRITSTVCFVCKKAIDGRAVAAMGQYFHPEHFTCYKCSKPFSTGHFLEYDGKAYCEAHYSEVSGSSCGKCFQIHSGIRKK